MLATAGFSQSIKSYVITSAGAALMNENGAIYLSLGEPMNTEIEGTDIMISQGFLNVTIAASSLSSEDLLTEVVKAYPNPTTTELTLELPEMSGEYEYWLTDFTGRLITKTPITEWSTDVDLSQMQPGTYFLKVIKENKSSKTVKIVKL